MTVAELMEILETCDPKAEVRLATQSNYPFQNTIAAVADGDYIVEAASYNAEPDDPADASILDDFNGSVDGSTVYIMEGSQRGYFTKRAWDIDR